MRFYPNVTDQIWHFIVPTIVFSIFVFLGPFGGALAGLSLGLIRELTEASGSRITLIEVKEHFTKLDPWIDVLFWTLGGLTASFILM